MSTVQNIVASVSVTLIFFGVALMLLPEGSMQKPFKTFLSVAIVATVVMSVSGAKVLFSEPDLDIFENDLLTAASGLAETEAELNIRATEEAVKSIIEENLKHNNVTSAQVSVSADISEDGIISITETVVLCDLNDMAVCDRVLKELGLDATVGERK